MLSCLRVLFKRTRRAAGTGLTPSMMVTIVAVAASGFAAVVRLGPLMRGGSWNQLSLKPNLLR